MSSRAHTWLVIALVIAPGVLVTSAAHAQPGRPRAPAKHAAPEDPKLKAGIALLEAHEYKKAAAELERVYTTTREPHALLWLGRALQESGKLAGALRAYSAYLRESDPSTVQARGVEVLGTIQALTMEVAIVTVSAPDGSTITVDDVVVGKTPLREPLYVDVGKRTIGATNGTATASKVIEAAEEGRLSVELLSPEVVPEAKRASAELPPPRATSAAPAPASEPSGSGISGLTIAGLGASTLLAAGSVYFAVKAAHSASTFDDKKGVLGVSRSELDALQGDTRVQAGLSVGLGIGALGLAGLTLLTVKKPGAEQPRAAAAPPRVVVTGRGLLFTGGF